MAMTKKERAAWEAMAVELDRLRALTAADIQAPERDLTAPKSGEPSTSGWDFNVYRMGRSSVLDAVYPAWSETTSHGEGEKRRHGVFGSQKSIALFSTREKALRALRAAVAAEYASKLAIIDAEISKEVTP